MTRPLRDEVAGLPIARAKIAEALRRVEGHIGVLIGDAHKPVEESARRVCGRYSDVRINCSFTEAELRVIRFALDLALEDMT